MNVTELTRKLVSIPSVNPACVGADPALTGEARMADYLSKLLLEWGAVVELFSPLDGRPCVTGFFDRRAEKTLLLEAHLDTVAVAGMTVDPFGGELQDGKLYGRGACDVKGPMAAMLTAIHDTGPAACNVLFTAVCDEESGFSGVRALVERLAADGFPRPDWALVAEPTGLTPLAGHKGVARWRIETRGRAAHSSTPQLGHNAIYEMAQVITRLENLAASLNSAPRHNKLGGPTLSVGTIAGGSAVNIVPDSCSIEVDRRLIPGETPEDAARQIEAALEGLNCRVVEAIVVAPPFEVAVDSAAVSACIRAATAVGVHVEPGYANYCTDASFYGIADVPAVVAGPGDIAQAHTADEFIEVAELERGVEFYKQILLA